ncbi:MAG TPA: DUF1353 domain-containing protein [Vicinamibacterales bacterium]|nr:DUF1353 domain-containing protein [Vicinamibacterales bacterium]
MRHRGYFLGDLDLRNLTGHGGRWFCLLSDLTYVDVDPETGREVARYTAVAGSLTNFASIPRPLWAIFPPYGKHTRAAVIHDDLCIRKTIPSREAHDLFKRMLEACRCSRFTVFAFWRAVRRLGPRFDGAEVA